MSTLTSYRMIKIDDGFNVVGFAGDDCVNYKVGLHYWPHFQRLRALYLLLSRGMSIDMSLNRDVLSVIFKTVFNALFGILMRKATRWSTTDSYEYRAWKIAENAIYVLNPYLAPMSLDIQTGVTILYDEKPLFMPHEIFHFCINRQFFSKQRRKNNKLKQSATSWRRSFMFILCGLCLSTFIFCTYQTLSTTVYEKCAISLAINRSFTVCDSLLKRILVAMLIQVLTYPSYGVIILLVFFILSRNIFTHDRIYAWHKYFNRWHNRAKEQECLDLMKRHDIQRMFTY